jgi:transducin (beta)-like 1
MLYVLAAGFIHSAFVLGYEAGLHKKSMDGNHVPPGALVSFVQKGLQYLELEANLNDVSSSFLQPESVESVYILLIQLC